MAVLQPCLNCPIRRADQPCEIRDAKRAALKGTGLTLARFRCSRLEAEMRSGRRVSVLVRYAVINHDPAAYEPQSGHLRAEATVIGRGMTPNRYVVWLDQQAISEADNLKNESGVVSIPLARIELLDEPDRPERVEELRQRDQAVSDAEAGIYL